MDTLGYQIEGLLSCQREGQLQQTGDAAACLSCEAREAEVARKQGCQAQRTRCLRVALDPNVGWAVTPIDV